MLEEKQTAKKPFTFKSFKINQDDKSVMKVGTDGVLLGAWSDTQNVFTVLDIGTGTGLIAIMLAQRLEAVENAYVHGVEIDEQAFKQAQENMALSPFANRVKCFHQSVQDFAHTTNHRYDLIISNPPFFTGGTFSHNQDKNNVRHTIKLSHNDLLNATRQLLHKTGKFTVILPLIEGLRFIEVARTYGFYNTKRTDVRPRSDKNIERLLLQFEFTERAIERDELVLLEGTSERDYSVTYKNLTRDFYINF